MDKIEELALRWFPKAFHMRDDRHDPVDLNYEPRKTCESALREMAAYSYRQADAVVSELSPEIEHYDPALVITQIRERLQRLAESVENGGKP